jgi:hypothetical protein
MTSYEILSDVDALGRVVLCRGCEEVYVCIGHASYRLPLAAFRELGRMMQEAVNHPALNPDSPRRPILSVLDGRAAAHRPARR